MNPWDDERCARLRQLWDTGLSASQIAAELNCGLTRNAVIGKAHRLRLPQRSPRTQPSITRPPKLPQIPGGTDIKRTPSYNYRIAPSPKELERKRAEIAVRTEQERAKERAVALRHEGGRTLPQLDEARDCRWIIRHEPLGSGLPTLYCGRPKLVQIAAASVHYCREHCLRAFDFRDARHRGIVWDLLCEQAQNTA